MSEITLNKTEMDFLPLYSDKSFVSQQNFLRTYYSV